MPKSRADWLAELQPYADEAARMTGWNFAHLPQPLGAPPPWDYEARARELAATAPRLVDRSGFSRLTRQIEPLKSSTTSLGTTLSCNMPKGRPQTESLSLTVPDTNGLATPCGLPPFIGTCTTM